MGTFNTLSLSQQRYWYMYRLEPASPVFNIVQAFEVDGIVDLQLLKDTLFLITQKQESLRTAFGEDKGIPYTKIVNSPEITIFVLDACDTEAIQAEIRKPFKLEYGPLFRVLLVNGNQEEQKLIFVMHQIIADRQSMQIIGKEIVSVYNSKLPDTGPISELFTYHKFADWQNDEFNTSNCSPELFTFWEEHLKGELPNLELPVDFSHPKELQYTGAQVPFTLSGSVTSHLEKIAEENETTLSNVLFAAYTILIYRYTGQKEIVAGTPVVNRSVSGTEQVIGSFENWLPIRLHIDSQNNFAEYVNNIKATVSECFSHSSVPFEKILERVNAPRDLTRTPLFQCAFIFDETVSGTLRGSGITLKPVFYDRRIAQYDLSLHVKLENNQLQGYFEYSTELLMEDTAVQISEQFQVLVSAISEGNNCQIGELPLLSKEDEHKLLVTWNNTTATIPEDCLHNLIRKQAQKTPGAVAITCGNISTTYNQLLKRADVIADALVNANATGNTFIGVMTSRNADMVAAIIAIHSIGAAYVPLDPAYPHERLNYMIGDADVTVIITEQRFRERLPDSKLTLIALDELDDGSYFLKEYPSVDSSAAAYMIYTSGSTGKPKGVTIQHRAVVNFLLGMGKMPGISSTDTLLAVTTLSFDISILELFLPLTAGARVVIADHSTSADGNGLKLLMQAESPTILQATPSTWRLVLAAGWDGSPQLKALCGGEPFPSDLAIALHPKVKELWNMYGPTETTVWSTCYKINRLDSPLLIGRPIQNTRTYILDELNQPVPVGVFGNLFIAGDGLALGYHNKPELTLKAFIPELSVLNRMNNRMYRTGDIARYRRDGNIEYLRRADTQVKVRGFRIELGDIEAAMSLHQAIHQCAAACHEQAPGDTRLALYYVLKNNQVTTTTDLRNHMKARLPLYMVPQHFVEMEKLPLTPAGKIDRKKLSLPFTRDTSQTLLMRLPESDAEKFLADVWKIFLKSEKISALDNFFDLGGHSLLSMQVIAHIFKETGCVVHPKEMMLNTLGQIAERIILPPAGVTPTKNNASSSIWGKFRCFLGYGSK